MTLSELKKEIMGQEIRPFYVFVGDEIGIMNIYLDQIGLKKGLSIVRKESVAEVYTEIQSTGFFDSEAKVYIVRGDKDFQKADNVWAEFVHKLKDNVVVLLYDKIDSRLKFGKFFKESTVQFEKLDRELLVKYIRNTIKVGSYENVTLDEKLANSLAEMCGDSYDICMLECDKILDYQKATKSADGYFTEPDGCFYELVADGAICQSQETDVFKFSEAVCMRDVRASFEIATVLKEAGVDAVTILGTLYTNLRAVMLIQSCEGKDIAEITGLDKGTIWYNKKRVGKYDIYDLVYAVKTVAMAVSDIKSGKLDSSYAVDYVLSLIL